MTSLKKELIDININNELLSEKDLSFNELYKEEEMNEETENI